VFAQHGGGKSANQAVAAARLGAAVALVGAVGDDAMGSQARAELAAEGIDVSGVVELSAPTGVALITVDEAGENQIAVASGANAAFSLGALDLSGAGVVLLGNEVSAEVVADAGRAAAAAGWPVILNPAPARPLPDVPLAVLTPNASEASDLTGCSDPAEAAARLVADMGAAVLITLGAEGGLLLEPDGAPERIASLRVDVVDTTGAGDTVNGALAAELARGRGLREAASFALVAAALSTRREGARGGMPTREQVEAAR
jgi:ribokinase